LYEDYLKGINYLGNAIEGNGDSVNKRFYGSILTSFHQIQPSSIHGVSTNKIQRFSTEPRHKSMVLNTTLVLVPTQFRGSQNNPSIGTNTYTWFSKQPQC
jgi:hypothetical protein